MPRDQLESLADALVPFTEWKRFTAPSFDGRNLYAPEHLAELGWMYYAIGRGASMHAVV